MIQTKEVIAGGEEYLGYARQKLAALEAARLQAGSPSMTWGPQTNGRVTIYIVSSDNGNLIRLEGEDISGFLFHPRSGRLASQTFSRTDVTELGPVPASELRVMVMGKGVDPAGVMLPNGPFIYPLIDNDHGTRNLYENGSGWELESDPPENYGNIDWTGDAVLTWRGPTNRHFPLDQTLEIPGLNETDETAETVFGSYNLFTTFGSNVYAGGEIAATAPTLDADGNGMNCRVIGAAFLGESLVIIVRARMAWLEPAGKPAYRERVFIQNSDASWTMIADEAGGRATHPFFFNGDGTQAVWMGELYTLTPTAAVKSSGSYISTGSESYHDEPYNVSKSGAWELHHDYNARAVPPFSALAHLTVTLVSIDKTTFESSPEEEASVTDDAPIYLTEAPPPLSVLGPGSCTVGATYTCPDGEAPFVWSTDKGVINSSTGVITSTAGACGQGVVTVRDACGRTGSKTVAMPTGIWILSSTETDDQVPASGTYCTYGNTVPCYDYSSDGLSLAVITGRSVIQSGYLTGLPNHLPASPYGNCGDGSVFVVRHGDYGCSSGCLCFGNNTWSIWVWKVQYYHWGCA